MGNKKVFCRRAGDFKPEMIETSEIIKDLMMSVKPETFIRWVRNGVLQNKCDDYYFSRNFKIKYPEYTGHGIQWYNSIWDVEVQLEELGFLRSDDVFRTMKSVNDFSFKILRHCRRSKEDDGANCFRRLIDESVFPTVILGYYPGGKYVSNSLYETYDESSVKAQITDMFHSYLSPLQRDLVMFFFFERNGILGKDRLKEFLSPFERDLLDAACATIYILMPRIVNILKESLS